jgi:hypothetical protein
VRILIPVLIVAISASVSAAGEQAFDLMTIGHVNPKGRIQDQPLSVPVVAEILASGPEAIPLLINLIGSEQRYENPPFDYWPEMHEGDMALVVLSDLFLDPTWRSSTLPEACWDNMLGRSGPDISAWRLLGQYIETHGREDLVKRWSELWSAVEKETVWDEEGRYFRVRNRELVSCF